MLALVQAYAMTASVGPVLLTAVQELQLLQALYRLLDLIINVGSILSIVFVFLGVALHTLSNSSEKKRWGGSMAGGGIVLLLLTLGLLEALIGLAKWVTAV